MGFGKGEEVRADVEKYNKCGFSGDKYLCVIEYGGPNMFDNCKYLTDNNPKWTLSAWRHSTPAILTHGEPNNL